MIPDDSLNKRSALFQHNDPRPYSVHLSGHLNLPYDLLHVQVNNHEMKWAVFILSA